VFAGPLGHSSCALRRNVRLAVEVGWLLAESYAEGRAPAPAAAYGDGKAPGYAPAVPASKDLPETLSAALREQKQAEDAALSRVAAPEQLAVGGSR
jgi:hypothetical protein